MSARQVEVAGTKRDRSELFEVFERIYATDLVFVPDCWKLCGDAHCCSFARHKARFRMIARTPFQELPLLPGEYEFLAKKGWLEQFGDHDHQVHEFPLDAGTLRVESIVSRKPHCACEHDVRPTVCRLYPLLPVFDVDDGRLVGTEPLGIYEEMERLAGLDPACQVSSLPFRELDKFLAVANALAESRTLLFYLEAYRRTKRHVTERLASRLGDEPGGVFAEFEHGFLRRRLIDVEELRAELDVLADEMRRRGSLEL